MLSNPYVRALLGGLAAAIAVATPLVVDNALSASEILSIAAAFLSGSGAVAVQPSGKPAEPKRWQGEA